MENVPFPHWSNVSQFKRSVMTLQNAKSAECSNFVSVLCVFVVTQNSCDLW